MKKITLVFLLVTSLVACKKDLTTLNIDPKNPVSVPSAALFTQGEHLMSNQIISSNVNLNIFRLIEQYWQETTYTDESNYNINTRDIPDGVWNALYTSLSNLERSKTVAAKDIADAATQKSAIAQADVLEVLDYYYLLTTFGNIPYTDALDINKPFPKYDDAATVFNDLLKRLDTDLPLLAGGSGFGAADQIYGGDSPSWVLFANSLKLKMGMTIADSDPTTAKATVQAAFTAGVFSKNSDNALFAYQSGPPNTNPIWVDLVQSGRQDFVACSTVVNYMVNTDSETGTQTIADPRTPYYFTTVQADPTTGYYGLDPGQNGSFGSYSKPSGPTLVSTSIGKITNADFPGDLLDYAEVQFLLAEAVQRGFITTGTVNGYYTAGIQASIQFWTEGADDGSAYAALNPYPVAGTATDQMNAIAFQKYLALYNRGWDAWIETRRLDFPKLVPPPPDLRQSDFPVRFTYPVNEQNVNVVNYNQASAAIGGDDVTTRLWFDKFDIGNNATAVTAVRHRALKKR